MRNETHTNLTHLHLQFRWKHLHVKIIATATILKLNQKRDHQREIINENSKANAPHPQNPEAEPQTPHRNILYKRTAITLPTHITFCQIPLDHNGNYRD